MGLTWLHVEVARGALNVWTLPLVVVWSLGGDLPGHLAFVSPPGDPNWQPEESHSFRAKPGITKCFCNFPNASVPPTGEGQGLFPKQRSSQGAALELVVQTREEKHQ